MLKPRFQHPKYNNAHVGLNGVMVFVNNAHVRKTGRVVSREKEHRFSIVCGFHRYHGSSLQILLHLFFRYIWNSYQSFSAKYNHKHNFSKWVRISIIIFGSRVLARWAGNIKNLKKHRQDRREMKITLTVEWFHITSSETRNDERCPNYRTPIVRRNKHRHLQKVGYQSVL